MSKSQLLRNAATRRVFFHNGRFYALRDDAWRFYVSGEIDSGLWYPRKPAGEWDPLEELAAQPAQADVDIADRPLKLRGSVDLLWTYAQLGEVVGFLQTLTAEDVASLCQPAPGGWVAGLRNQDP